jgi:hypothetical protein
MRAKFEVGMVQEHHYGEGGAKTQETVTFHAVAASSYPEDGTDENNTFAKFSPGANCAINIANPALFGAFKHGDRFYVDFTPAPK